MNEPNPTAQDELLIRLAALRADQQRRWDQGERVLAEDYLRLLPDLSEDSSLALDVIYSEIRLRTERGETIGESEYLQRFPGRAESLRQLFAFFRRMHDTSIAPKEAPTGDTLPPRPDSLPMALPTEPPLAPPGYELLGKLGEGGMGVVYRARHLALNRIVALKVLKGTEPGDLERFRSEAETIARLQHPNIVQVFEVGEHHGQPYLTQELVEGGSLADLLAKEPLAAREAARLVEELARAVQHAHDRGVIHRDLKPGNVLLAPGRAGKVTDFGLARRLGEDVRRTVSGVILGTPSYMPPEQAGGDLKAVGPLSDVYSLGAILYECLTGRPPFRTANVFQTILLVRSEDPVAPQRLQPGVPRDLDTICLKCLRKKPEERYASCLQLAEDLHRFQNGEPIQARPVGRVEKVWRWCRRKPGLASLLALGVVLLAALIWSVRRAEQAQSEHDHQQQLNAVLEREKDAEQRARAAAEESSRVQAHTATLRQIQMRNARRLLGWKRASLADLTALARQNVPGKDVVELRKQAALCLGGLDLGPGKVLLDQFDAYALTFTPDGKYLAAAPRRAGAFGLGDEVRLIELATGTVAHGLRFPGIGSTTGLATFSPDGLRSLACSRDGKWLAAGTRGGRVHCWRLPPQGKDPQLSLTVTEEGDVPLLGFRGDGTLLYTGSEPQGLLRSWELPSGKAVASYRGMGHLLGLAVSGQDFLLCSVGGLWYLDPLKLVPVATLPLAHPGKGLLHPGGRLLAVEEAGRIALLDRESRGVLRWLPPEHEPEAHAPHFSQLQFSPCGSFLLSGSESGERRLKLWDVLSGELLLEVPGGHLGSLAAAFSPGGDWLAISMDRRVVLHALAGQREQTYVGVQPFEVHATAFTNDGELVTLTRKSSKPYEPRELGFWRPANPHPVRLSALQPALTSAANTLAAHPLEKGVVCLGGHHQVDLVRLGTPEGRADIRPYGPEVLTLDAAGARVWSAKGVQVQAWSWPEGKPLRNWSAAPVVAPTGREQVDSLAAGRDWVAVGCRNGQLHVLAAATATPHKSRFLSKSALKSVALHPGEPLAAAGNQEGQVFLLKTPTQEEVQTLHDHADSVAAVAFSPDGRLLATAGRDREVHLYEKRGERFARWLTLPFARPVLSVRFDPDGKRLAVLLQNERGVRLWHLDRLRQGLTEAGLD